MKVVRLTSNRLKALEALASCQYLTLDQFLRLGITNDKSNLTKRVLQPLRDNQPALVTCGKRGAMKEDVYCLTRRGAAMLAEKNGVEADTITFPSDGIQFELDFPHRRGTIDFLIEMKLWADRSQTQIEFVHGYYTKIGSQRGKRPCFEITRHLVDGLTMAPDLEFMLDMPDRQRRLFAFEYHRGNDSEKIFNQLIQHTKALRTGTISEHYGHAFANRMLSVYEHPSILQAVRKRLIAGASFKHFAPHFLFASLDEIKADFSSNWTAVDGSNSPLFDI